MTDEKEEVLDQQLPTNVKQKLDRIAENEGYISYDMTNNIINNKENYLAILHEVEIKGKTKDRYKEICLFLKLPQQFNLIFFTMEEAYYRESYAYSELFKIYEEFQDKASVPDEERFNAVKCFDGTSSEAIILENVSRKGFKIYPKMEVITLRFAELSIKQLATFHALSIVLRNQRPEYFNNKVVPLKYMITVDCDERKAVMMNFVNNSYKYLSEDSKKRLSILLDTATEEVKKHLEMTKNFKCLCHGDFKTSNLLFKEQDCSIKEVIMIDHQVIHYGSPFNDLTLFILLGTDREFRKKHLDHLKNFYYSSLQQFLIYFNINLNDIWSREEFEKQFQESLNFELIRCMIIFPLAFADENHFPDLKNDISTININVDSRLKDRIQGIVDDFFEWRGIFAKSMAKPANSYDADL